MFVIIEVLTHIITNNKVMSTCNILKITDRKELSTVDSISGKKKKKKPFRNEGEIKTSR